MANNNSTSLYIVKSNNDVAKSNKYHYPSTLLDQPYFVTPATGKADLQMGMLSHDRFVSPALRLLKEMRADGHDVSGVFDEVQALYCLIKQQNEWAQQIRAIASKAIFIKCD